MPIWRSPFSSRSEDTNDIKSVIPKNAILKSEEDSRLVEEMDAGRKDVIKEPKSFNAAFGDARKSGSKVFTWRGKSYTTKLKGEASGDSPQLKLDRGDELRNETKTPMVKPPMTPMAKPSTKPAMTPMAKPATKPAKAMAKPDKNSVQSTIGSDIYSYKNK